MRETCALRTEPLGGKVLVPNLKKRFVLSLSGQELPTVVFTEPESLL